ncbi:hypothetical protein EJ02DRAFT_320883, partial [Clathrospora elynae]
IEDKLAAIKSLDEGEQFAYQAIADIYGVSRTTWSRRHRQVQGSREEQAINLQLLGPHQEAELV